MVCSEDTIEKMLDANEEWARLLFEIKNHFKSNKIDGIERMIYVQEKCGSYLRKIADFNIVARRDLKISFDDQNKYIDIFEKSYGKLSAFLKTLIRRS